MAFEILEKGQAIRPEVMFINLDPDVEDEDIMIDCMFAEPEELSQELYVQRLLNSSLRGRI